MRKKIILRGNPKEIDNLKELLINSKKSMPEICPEYQTLNLWQIKDVQNKYECTEEEAMEVLEEALCNEATIDQIRFAIDFHAEELGLDKK